MAKSFKDRLFISLGLIILLFASSLFLSVSNYQKREVLFALSVDVLSLQSETHELSTRIANLISKDYADPLFYQKKQEQHHQFIDEPVTQIKAALVAIEHGLKLSDLPVNPIAVKEYSQLLDSLAQLGKRISQNVFEVGHRDFGLVGRLREHAHYLEEKKVIAKTEILGLRRLEKDYLLRKDPMYIDQFSDKINQLKKKYAASPEALYHLDSYFAKIDSIATLYKAIDPYGWYEHSENRMFKSTLEELTHLESSFIAEIDKGTQYLVANLKTQFWVLALIVCLLSTVFLVFIPNAFSKSLERINEGLNKLSLGERTTALDFVARTSEMEGLRKNIVNLHQRFLRLMVEKEKAVELAERKEEAKGVFLRTMSHEIRTPLNGITGIIQAAKPDFILNKKEGEYKVLENSVHHLIGLVNGILDYSKLEAQKMTLTMEEVNLYDTLEFVVQSQRAMADEKGLQFELDSCIGSDTYIRTDKLRLSQILINLLNNALKFTQEGKVVLQACLEKGPKGEHVLNFAIRDTGIGISSDQIEKIKEAFVQSDSNTTRNYGGSGLGLSIAEELIQLFGGKMDIRSTEHIGTTISFSIPCEVVSSKANESTTEEENQFVGKRILVAEDHPVNRRVLGHLLKKTGVEYVFAEDGLEAVEQYEKEHFDAILMDLHMPNLNGLDASRQICASPKYQAAPIAISAVTASSFQEDVEEAKAAGMDYFVSKPIDKVKLIAALEKMLAGQAEPELV